MNKIFQVIYSQVKKIYVVVSEKGRKSHGSGFLYERGATSGTGFVIKGKEALCRAVVLALLMSAGTGVAGLYSVNAADSNLITVNEGVAAPESGYSESSFTNDKSNNLQISKSKDGSSYVYDIKTADRIVIGKNDKKIDINGETGKIYIGTDINDLGAAAKGFMIDGINGNICNYNTGCIIDADVKNGIALGKDSKVYSSNSFAFGSGAVAGKKGDEYVSYAVAWGYGTASGSRSTAWGDGTASGIRSTAWGYGTASGGDSTAWGDAEAEGENSTAWGDETYARGMNSTAWGRRSYAKADYSTAWGRSSKASGKYSTAFGQGMGVDYFCTDLGKKLYFEEWDDSHDGIVDAYFEDEGKGIFYKYSYPNSAAGGFPAVGTEITVMKEDQELGKYRVIESYAEGRDLDENQSLTMERISGSEDLEKIMKISAGLPEVEGSNKLIRGNVASGKGALAFGFLTRSDGYNSTSFGIATKALGETSLAFGRGTRAEGMRATAFGLKTKALGENSTAWGNKTEAVDERTTAWGYKTFANGHDSTAFGHGARAIGTHSTAWGYKTLSSGKRSTAFGDFTNASGKNAVAFGLGGILPDENNEFSDPEEGDPRKADPAYGAIGDNSFAHGIKTKAEGAGATSWGNETVASGENSTAWGEESKASGDNSTAFGVGSNAEGANSLAALGGHTTAEAKNSVAIGKDAVAKITDSVAIGTGSVSDRKSGKQGYGSDETTAVWKSTANGISVGNVQYDAEGKIIEGNVTITRQITGVAAGTNDTDAVNVAQLKKAKVQISGGDNVTVEEGNSDNEYVINVDLSDIEEKVNNSTFGLSADDNKKAVRKTNKTIAIKGDSNIKTSVVGDKEDSADLQVSLAKDVKDIDTISINNSLSVGGDTYISKEGIDSNNKKIVNVKNGDISEKSTDAVNGSQLFETNKKVTFMGDQINNLESKTGKGIAGAAAVAALHPLDFDPDDKLNFAVGYGNYAGENAAALGAFYRPDESTLLSVGGSIGNSNNVFNVGLSFNLDHKNNVSNSRVALAKQVIELTDELNKIKAILVAEGHKEFKVETDRMFPDVPENHWAYEYIHYLASRGIIEGYPNGKFLGDRMMTRYEYATIIYRLMQRGFDVDRRALDEFEHELLRIRVDLVHGDADDEDRIERVRINSDLPGRDKFGGYK